MDRFFQEVLMDSKLSLNLRALLCGGQRQFEPPCDILQSLRKVAAIYRLLETPREPMDHQIHI